MALHYRARQFFYALKANPSTEDLDQVRKILSPPLMELFSQMQPGEQVHSLNVFKHLVRSEEKSADLLVSALLHDIGKIRFPLRAWERALVVIVQALIPSMAEEWGRAEPHGWKRSFAVAARHPEWGAELAQAAGASPLTVSLIRRHREKVMRAADNEDQLLLRLQRFDNES